MSTDTRLNAWQQLGETITVSQNAKQTLDEAGLSGWNVRKSPLTTIDNGTLVDVPDQFAILRNTEQGPAALGVVGKHYHPVQNEEQIGLLEALVDEGGAVFETAGQMKGGRNVFITMKLPESVMVAGTDRVDLYLAAFNSHDGQSAFRFVVTPIRVWCANMQAAVTKSALASFTKRHTLGGASAAVQQAREALGLVHSYQEAFQAEADRLIAQEYTDQQFRRLTASLFPSEGVTSTTASENQARHRQGLFDLWDHSDTAHGIGGTRWGAYQAVTEYLDHYLTSRGKAGDVLREARAAAAINPGSPSTRTKERAFQLLTK